MRTSFLRPIESPVITLVLTGLISILGQIILLRELNVAFYGSELVYIFSLGLWLLGTAIGALLQKRLAGPSLRRIAFGLALSGLLLLGDIAFIRGSRVLFGAVPGAYLPFLQQLFLVVLALLPISFLSGLLFAWAAKCYIGEEEPFRSLRAAYALESAGGLAGGLAATLCFHWGIQNLPLALCCAYLTFLAPLLPAQPATFWWKRIYAATMVLMLLLLVAMWPFTSLDRVMTRWNHPHLVTSQDTPYGRITLAGTSGQLSLFENDVLSYETEGTDAEAFIHPAALQHPAPQQILVLGGGVEGLVGEILRHHPQRVDYVELNVAMLKTAIPYLPPAMRTALSDPRVRIIEGDPRQFLKSGGLYDLILVGMPEPHTGAANRFYTREFFLQCAARLQPQGIIALRLKPSENFWTPPMALRMGSIYKALRTVFPECRFLPGATQVITASFDPLPHSPELPIARWQARHLQGHLINPAYLSYLYTNDRYLEINNRLEQTTVPANMDSRPVCYQFSTLIWLAKFYPELNTVTFYNPFQTGGTKDRLPHIMLFLAVLAVFSLCRRFSAARRLLLMSTVAFTGMVLEAVLLLHYQIKEGVLYQDMGLLLTVFMAGLTLGALIFRDRKPQQAWASGLVIGSFLTAVLIYIHIVSDPFPGLPATMILLGLNGLCISAIFTYISLFQIANPRHMVSSLYSADLAGGCLGALASGLVLIPFFGLDMTVAFMIIMNATLLILVE